MLRNFIAIKCANKIYKEFLPHQDKNFDILSFLLQIIIDILKTTKVPAKAEI